MLDNQTVTLITVIWALGILGATGWVCWWCAHDDRRNALTDLADERAAADRLATTNSDLAARNAALAARLAVLELRHDRDKARIAGLLTELDAAARLGWTQLNRAAVTDADFQRVLREAGERP